MVKEYFLKNGEKRYKFSVYLGTDALGKQKFTNRSGFKTKREATIEKRRLANSISPDKTLRNKDMTFKELYNLWFESYKTTVKPNTYIAVESEYKLILNYFGHLKLNRITTAYCQKVFIEWSKNLKSYKMYVSKIKSLLKYAKGLRLIDDNPIDYVILPKIEKRKKDEELFFTKEELKEFLDFAKQEYTDHQIIYYALFRLLSFSGMRIGEALALNWADIDFIHKTIDINKSLTKDRNKKNIVGSTKTKNSVRTISIDDMTLNILNKWRLEQKKLAFKLNNMNVINSLVFTHTGSLLYSQLITHQLKYLCNKYGLKSITLHGFRHTHCSLLFESEADIKEVQYRLGHSNVQTTLNIYTHINQQRTKDTAKKFVRYVNF